MRGEKRNVAHYAEAYCQEHGLPINVVHKVLMHMTQQLCSKIARGRECIKRFGRIPFSETSTQIT